MSGATNVSSLPANPPPLESGADTEQEYSEVDPADESGDIESEDTGTEGNDTEAKAKREAGPRKLSGTEASALMFLANQLGEDESPTEKKFAYGDLNLQVRHMISPMSKPNLIQRGLLAADMDETSGAIRSVTFTNVGWDLYQRRDEPTVRMKRSGAASNGEKKERVITDPFRQKYDNPHHRIRKLREDNPRREKTHGHYSWNLYQDGMTYREYLDAAYDNELVTNVGSNFTGPGSNHFLWDLSRGWIGIYDDREEEFLEDGSPNPKYWVIKLV